MQFIMANWWFIPLGFVVSFVILYSVCKASSDGLTPEDREDGFF